MKRITSDKTILKLTSDQQNALNAFKVWIEEDYSSRPFVLSGCAGTGKTFLSTRFLDIAQNKSFCWTVAAPTHKAVGVLRRYLELENLKAVWYPSTIHRLLRLKLKREGDKEICEETDQTANSLENLDLVLIDESSMLDSNLLEIILKYSFSFKTRIVFIGDPAQLPPVGEKLSPVFSIKRSIRFQLKEVVRHKGAVLNLATNLRNGLLPCEAPPPISAILNDISFVGCLDNDNWLEKAKCSLKEAAENDKPDAARILCYTNRALEKLVPHARRAIHGEMADQMFILPGEIVISRTAIMAPASLENSPEGEEPDMLLGSNRELLVEDVKPENFEIIEPELSKSNSKFPTIIKTLTAKVSCGELSFSLRIAPPLGSNSRKLLDKILKDFRSLAMRSDKKSSRSFWKSFFFIRDSFAYLGPASVLTVHRSQGSTFGEVFVCSDIFWPKDLSLRRQLAYVAVSRAKDGVWMHAQQGNRISSEDWSTFINS